MEDANSISLSILFSNRSRGWGMGVGCEEREAEAKCAINVLPRSEKYIRNKKVEEINRGHFSDKSRWSINIKKV